MISCLTCSSDPATIHDAGIIQVTAVPKDPTFVGFLSPVTCTTVGAVSRGEREGGPEMSAEENKAVLRREVEELYNHTGNLDVVEEIFSPDYVSHEPTLGEVRGIEGARQFAATF